MLSERERQWQSLLNLIFDLSSSTLAAEGGSAAVSVRPAGGRPRTKEEFPTGESKDQSEIKDQVTSRSSV